MEKPRYPCPLCKHPMRAHLEISAYPLDHDKLGGYTQVILKTTCTNDVCRYEERTKAKSQNPETINKLLDVCMAYRGPEMFKHGKFEQGNVGVNRRRHTGIYRFEPVEMPKGEK